MSHKIFEVETPDGRRIRHQHASLDAARSALTAGYKVVGEVVGSDSNMKDGVVVPLAGKSLLSILLEAHGDELLTWLDNHDRKNRAVTK